MNAKRAKLLRQQVREAGYDLKENAMQYGLYRDGTSSTRIVRTPDSGRNVYQQMKRLEK